MSEKIKSIIGGGYMWNEREEKWIMTPPDDPELMTYKGGKAKAAAMKKPAK